MKLYVAVAFAFFTLVTQAQIKLTHNVGNQPIETLMFSCNQGEYWARAFILEDFGISTQDEPVIDTGQIAFSTTYQGATAQFNIYEIDENFPASFSEDNLIGSSQEEVIPFASFPKIFTMNFTEPIIVPKGVERILVEVKKGNNPSSPAETTSYIAGTEEDTDISWYYGCGPENSYTPSGELSLPRPNANFFLNVTVSNLLSTPKITDTTFKLYPNPATDILSIASKLTVERVQIFTLDGVQTMESSHTAVDISALPVGLYFAKVWVDDSWQIQKFLKR